MTAPERPGAPLGSLRLRPLARRLRADLERTLQKSAYAAGYEFFRRHFTTPMPCVDELPDRLWIKPSALPGVDLCLPAAEALLGDKLAPFLAEFQPPRRRPAAGGFWLDNGGYGTADAETLWAMLRHLKPRRVFELGSGASSHVIAAAGSANAAAGFEFIHRVFDPLPFSNPIGPVPSAVVDCRPTEAVPVETFAELEPGDVLFVDTTHTVKTGGDVTHVILDVLPDLRPGVVIHFHDIFLPYDYPRQWVVDWRLAWAEQYLLQAFLAFNHEFEVVLPVYALARARPSVVSAHIPSFTADDRAGAFWIRRRRASDDGAGRSQH